MKFHDAGEAVVSEQGTPDTAVYALIYKIASDMSYRHLVSALDRSLAQKLAELSSTEQYLFMVRLILSDEPLLNALAYRGAHLEPIKHEE